MNQKIESTNSPNTQQTSEFSPDFIRVLVALTGATLLLVFVFERDVFHIGQYSGTSRHNYHQFRSFLIPWAYAAGQTIEIGLDQFRGHTPALSSFAERMATLLGLLSGFIIGPTLFFFGWHQRRKDRAAGLTTSSLKGSAAISIIGGILTFAVAIPSIPIAYIQNRVAESVHSAQAVQGNKDQMINDLWKIAYNAKQFRILPKNLDGGNGSYLGYTLSQPLAGTEEGTYEISCKADEITVKAISKKYPDCRISARIDKEGGPSFEFYGQFL